MASRPPLDRYARISNWYEGGFYIPEAYLYMDGPSGFLYNRQGQATFVGNAVWKDLMLTCQRDREAYYTGQKNAIWPGPSGWQPIAATQTTHAYSEVAPAAQSVPGLVRFPDRQVGINFGQQGDIGLMTAQSLVSGYNPPVSQPPLAMHWPLHFSVGSDCVGQR